MAVPKDESVEDINNKPCGEHKMSSRQFPVNQEMRHMYRKERYDELKTELQRDFEAKHTFKPSMKVLSIFHVGSHVDAHIHNTFLNGEIDGNAEWIPAIVRSVFADDDTFEIELLDESRETSLMRLPRKRIRASAIHETSIDDMSRRFVRIRPGTVRRQDFRNSEDRELEEECTFQPSINPPRKVVQRVIQELSKRRRQAPPPPNSPSTTHRATHAGQVFLTGGGLFVPGQGLLPGAPASIGIALFYYNATSPPSFSSGTYKVIQYTPVAELGRSGGSSSTQRITHLPGNDGRSARSSPANVWSSKTLGFGSNKVSAGDNVPVAPALPAWVWTDATSSGGNADVLQTPGKSTPFKRLDIKKKTPGETKKDEKASGSGWQNVLEELARRVGGGKGNDSLLKKVEVRQVGKLSTGKKGRRGAKDFTDVIDELSYTLARMRGETKDDDKEDAENSDDEDSAPSSKTSPLSSKGAPGKISALFRSPPPPPAPPQASAAPVLKLARPAARIIPQPPVLDDSKFPYKQKETAVINLGKLFPSVPSMKLATKPVSTRPAPPPLPSTWPPENYRGATSSSGDGRDGENVETSYGSGGREKGGSGAADSNSASSDEQNSLHEVPLLSRPSGDAVAINGETHKITYHENVLPAGYYAAAPESIAVTPGSIVPAGTTLTEHLAENAPSTIASEAPRDIELMSEENSIHMLDERDSGRSIVDNHPADYFAAVQRMRHAHDFRRAREESQHLNDSRYFDEAKLHERPKLTLPEEFHFAAAERAEKKKVFTHRKIPDRSDELQVDLAHESEKFIRSLRDYSPEKSRRARSCSPSRSKSAPLRSHSRGSIIFSSLAQDFPSPSKTTGIISLSVMSPSLTQPVEPKLQSPFVAMKNRELRLRRQQERDEALNSAQKRVKERREALHQASISTYTITPRRHAHARIIAQNPEVAKVILAYV